MWYDSWLIFQVFTHNGDGIPLYGQLGDQAVIRQLVFPYSHWAVRNHIKVRDSVAMGSYNRGWGWLTGMLDPPLQIVSPKWFNCYVSQRWF
jgi:hypothetical protein